MTKKTLKLSEITADKSLNVRAGGVDHVTAREYSEILDRLPPIEVYEVRGKNYVVDGFHRLHAHELAGREEIEVQYSAKKTWQEAEARAAEVNTQHGKPLTIVERHAGIRVLLRLKYSQTETANRMGVNPQLVSSIAKADRLMRKHGVEGLTMTHWREVGRLPEGQQKQFAETVHEQMWSRDEARIAADAIMDDSRDAGYREKLLRGDADPIQVSNGEASVSTDTVVRKVEKAQEGDLKAPLWDLLRAAAVLDNLIGDGAEDVGAALAKVDMSAADRDRLEDGLGKVAGLAAELRKGLTDSRKLQAV